jgi:Ran GTPase-activating protein (RanGAP) involved in mRNA processing and transport
MKQLTSLSLKSCGLGNSGAELLAQVLKSPELSLQHLDLALNDIGSQGGLALADGLIENTTLTELVLSANNLGKAGRSLSNAIRDSKMPLTTLFMGSTQLGDSFNSFCAMLHKTRLTSWYAGNNQVGEEGLRYLALALKHRETLLTSLDLSYNTDLSYSGLDALSDSLALNYRLTSLNFSGCTELKDPGVRCLSYALRKSTCGLSILYLYDCCISDKGLEHLSSCLNLSKLEYLGLQRNFITDDGIAVFCKALRLNKTLKQLFLEDNAIESRGRAALRLAAASSALVTFRS